MLVSQFQTMVKAWEVKAAQRLKQHPIESHLFKLAFEHIFGPTLVGDLQGELLALGVLQPDPPPVVPAAAAAAPAPQPVPAAAPLPPAPVPAPAVPQAPPASPASS